jgi:hypothetical protein
MKRELMRLTTLAAVTVAALIFFAAQADAEIRVVASVNAPGVRVHASNVPSCYHSTEYYGRREACRHMRYEITRRDLRIARRLAYFSGVPARRLTRLRRRGFQWFEIGRMIYVPRYVVRAAMHQRSWNRFLREERRHARRYGRRKHRVTWYDGREYRGR